MVFVQVSEGYSPVEAPYLRTREAIHGDTVTYSGLDQVFRFNQGLCIVESEQRAQEGACN